MEILPVFLIAFVVGDAFAVSLPSYIPKCTLSDPKLSECIVENANKAIPRLVEGDEVLGISSLLHMPTIILEEKDFKISLKDVELDTLKNVKVEKAWYNVKTGLTGFDGVLEIFTMTGKYSVTDGKILSDSVTGSGNFNITMIGNKLEYRSKFRLYEKNDKVYEQFFDSSMDFFTKDAYYFFENLESTNRGDRINSYINEHSTVFKELLKPSIDRFMVSVVNGILHAINDQIPLHEIAHP